MSQAPIYALIFDMDGVLVDSEPLHLIAYQKLMSRFGHQYTEEENRQFLGRTDHAIAKIMIERYSLEATAEEIVSGKEEFLTDLLSKNCAPQQGVLNLLEKAKALGLPMAVASSAVLSTIELVVKTLGIRHFFQTLTSGQEVEHGKPSPDVFLLAAQRLGVEPQNCMVIEDTYNGILAAKAAGMTCIAVPCNATRHQDHSLADRKLFTLEELDLNDWVSPNR